MDWDGIGTFALFISSGGLGLGFIALMAYKARLSAKIETARLESGGGTPDSTLDQIRELEEQVERLTERVDFTEKLLGDGGRSED